MVRNLATIGGNLGTATPAGDLILGAGGLRWQGEASAARRASDVLSLEEFLVGPQQTALAPDELIIEVVIPVPAGKSGSGFQKLGKRKAMTISTASAAASVVLERRRQDLREGQRGPGLARADGHPLDELRARLCGASRPTLEEIEKVRYLAGGDACPSPRARRASAWYRCEVAAVLAARAVEDALARATGQDFSAAAGGQEEDGQGHRRRASTP